VAKTLSDTKRSLKPTRGKVGLKIWNRSSELTTRQF
jgi:uncharacterized protein YacL